MTDKRLIIIALVLLGAVVTLLWWIQSSASKSIEQRGRLGDDLLTGDRKTRGKAAPIRKPRLQRSRRAADRVLELALPEDDPRARAGGARVLVVMGNNVGFRRRRLEEPRLVRGVLGRDKADRLIQEALELPASEDAHAWRLDVRLAAGVTTRRVAAGGAATLQARPLPREVGYVGHTVFLQLAPAGEDAEPATPWPFPAAQPDGFLAAPVAVSAPRNVLDPLLDAWKTPPVFTFEREGRTARYRVLSLDLLGPR